MKNGRWGVYLAVLLIASAGLVYELVASTLASYVLGDSVTQFSTVIGTYLSALGIGAYLSRWVTRGLARRFVEVELGVALLGGLSAPLLFLAFGSWPSLFRPILYAVVLAIGVLVGLEIPLVLRLLRSTVDFKELVSQVLTFDYLGALVASLAFPLLFVPHLGLVRTSLLFGLINALVGLWSTSLFLPLLGAVRGLRLQALLAIAILLGAFAFAQELTDLGEEGLYADPVIHARSSRYQRIVLTRSGRHFQLFLNGALQFSSADEYRYHEALVHPAMALRPDARRVLVLGGGDGLAVREVLKHPRVAEVVLVELDPEMTRLARDNPLLAALNESSLHSPRVRVIHADAFSWLTGGDDLFDLAVADFPDPTSFSLGKLYTRHFYARLARRLSPDGVLAVQGTSPLFSRRSFWCVASTIEAAGFRVLPYRASVPSFGEWGFVLASREPLAPPSEIAPGLRYLDTATLGSLFTLGPDLAPVEVDINRLNNQVLVRYYEEDLEQWN